MYTLPQHEKLVKYGIFFWDLVARRKREPEKYSRKIQEALEDMKVEAKTGRKEAVREQVLWC